MTTFAPLRRLGPLAALTTPRGFRVLALVAVVGLWVIVPSGAVVRLTGSGLGCPDWPLCDGRVVPAAAGHAWIEFSNRLLSGLVMAVSVATWLCARFLLAGRPRHLRRWAGVIALATAGQVPLGAVTVIFDLHPLLVGSHFLLSMVALAGGSVLALRAHDHARGVERGWSRPGAWLASPTALALAAVLVTGVLVTAAGPHPGDRAVVERFGTFGDAAYVHVRVVIAFCVLAVALVAWAWRAGRLRGGVRALGIAFLPLIAAQIAIGEYQYRSGLPWEVVTVHVTVAGLVWAVGVALAWSVARPEIRSAPASAPAAPRRLAGHAPDRVGHGA